MTENDDQLNADDTAPGAGAGTGADEIVPGETVTVGPGEQIPDGAGSCAMLHGQGLTTFSRTRTGLLAQVIDGYGELARTAVQTEDDDPLLDARYDFAVETASILQAAYLDQGKANGVYDVTTETDEDAYLAYAQERDVPFEGVRPEAGDEPAFGWDREVPLVLIRTDYHPFTDRPVPVGRVVFIDPATETTLLDTLHAAGLIVLLSREDSE